MTTTYMEQWVSQVINQSSYWLDVSGGWAPQQIEGLPDAFPAYGDNPLAW